MKEKEKEKILKALANKRRLAILSFLKKSKGVNVGGIADHIKLSFKATSKNLGILIAADFLEREQVNTEVFYKINNDAPKWTKDLLDAISKD